MCDCTPCFYDLLLPSLLVFGDIQREAAAKLEAAQQLQERTEGERDEALQGMAHAQVPIASGSIGSTFDTLCSPFHLAE